MVTLMSANERKTNINVKTRNQLQKKQRKTTYFASNRTFSVSFGYLKSRT